MCTDSYKKRSYRPLPSSKTLTFKMRPCAQPFLREYPGELGNGLLRTTNLELILLKCLQNFLWHYAVYVAKKYCIVMDKFQSVEASTLRLSGVEDSILFFVFYHGSNFLRQKLSLKAQAYSSYKMETKFNLVLAILNLV